MTKAILKEATLVGCYIYGISAWDLDLQAAEVRDLNISPHGEHPITVDNLEVAQFIYLMLKNQKLREVIDTITSKVVLILGRFKEPYKEVLDALREEVRKNNYVPVMFDFQTPISRDTQETVTLLARLCRFVIADLTEAKCIPAELVGIVQSCPSVPVKPLLAQGSDEYGMYDHIKRYPWVLEVQKYKSVEELLGVINAKVIAPAEEMADKLQARVGDK